MSSFTETLLTRRIPFLVAEIGVNHEGSVEKAKELVGLAAEFGADAVKFQTFVPKLYVSTDDADRFNRVSKFALNYEDFIEIKKYCDKLSIPFFSTPLAPVDVEFLDSWVDIFKISSGDLTNSALISSVASKGKPTILSTGFGSLSEIEGAIQVYRSGARKVNAKELVLMHTVPRYPTSNQEANLRNIIGLRERFDCLVGYSDHTIGIQAALAAHILGAKVIEKHFTDKKTERTFRDHALSAEPQDLMELKSRLEEQESLLGSVARTVSDEQIIASREFRRSIATARNLPMGHKLEMDDFISVRPGLGVSPDHAFLLEGRTLNKDKAEGSLLKLEDLV